MSSTRSSSSSTFRSEHISTYSPTAQGCFEPLLDPPHGIFGATGRARESYGYSGSPPPAHPSALGSSNVIANGDKYQVMADVSQFEPQDIVVTTYNYCIVIQAEKVAEDGTISNTFTHKCQLPADMDPLSISCSLNDAGNLIITARRQFLAPPPVYRSEVKL
ncbi:heat shock protein beta-7-like [Elgaria multicarinata webbii]|uniref:heat shock protein beta-7-like n=1 Tax=Elgaria multicarinata webbii TaxID=159646 RepID=UPI002FCD55B3